MFGIIGIDGKEKRNSAKIRILHSVTNTYKWGRIFDKAESAAKASISESPGYETAKKRTKSARATFAHRVRLSRRVLFVTVDQWKVEECRLKVVDLMKKL